MACSSTAPATTSAPSSSPAAETPRAGKVRRHPLQPTGRRTHRPPRGSQSRDLAWHNHSCGQVTFARCVETVWLPSKHVETSTLAAYRWARSKTECSMVCYVRADAAERPRSVAVSTPCCTSDGRTLPIGRRPKVEMTCSR
jgi:hypothetical protein